MYIKKEKPIYAIYKGEELLFTGTMQECADYFQVKKEYITYLCCPANLKRISNPKDNSHKVGVRLDPEDGYIDDSTLEEEIIRYMSWITSKPLAMAIKTIYTKEEQE